MAGFNKVKVTVLNSKNEIMIQDVEPRDTIEYQKFYDSDEFNDWSEEFVFNLVKDFPEDVYTIEVNTLGAYGVYKGLFTIRSEMRRCYTFS